MKKSHSVRSSILDASLVLQLNMFCFHSHGAAGDVDLSFDPGSGVNGTVLRWEGVPSPDGKWLAHHDKNQELWVLDLERRKPGWIRDE